MPRVAQRTTSTRKSAPTQAQQISGFLAKFLPTTAAQLRAARAKLRRRIPGATEMVYDNYNALVFGFGPTDRPSEAILSLAVMPRWVTLCFIQGAKLPDPDRILRGSGNQVRSLRLLDGPGDLDRPAVRKLVDLAIARSKPPMPASPRGRTIIKSISAKQRPRRP